MTKISVPEHSTPLLPNSSPDHSPDPILNIYPSSIPPREEIISVEHTARNPAGTKAGTKARRNASAMAPQISTAPRTRASMGLRGETRTGGRVDKNSMF